MSWRRPLRRGAVVALVCAFIALAVIRACQGPPSPPFRYTLRVLGGSELADMAPILRQAARATGVTVEFTPVGSVQGSQEVVSGKARRAGYDAVWFASSSYLRVFGGLGEVTSSTPIMESPVVLGVRSSVARALGWDRTPPTWRQVASEAEAGTFTFGMTDPATSNSGFSTILSLATTVAGNGAALRSSELTGSIRDLTHLFHGQVLKRPSSGFLTNAYLQELRHPPATGAPDGIFDYESQLITLQHEAPAGDPLTLVYPSGQALTADYELSILNSAPAKARAAWQRLVDYLQKPPAQSLITAKTHRRPVDLRIPLERELARHPLPAGLPFPDSGQVVTRLIDAYAGRLRRPGRTIYVLDVSSSMALPVPGGGGATGLGVLQSAMSALTGADTTSFGRLSMFHTGEEVIFLPFNNGAFRERVREFRLPASGDIGPDLAGITGYLGGLRAARGTWLYAALEYAYQLMAADDRSDPGRIDSIVVLSDGFNTGRVTLADFLAAYRARWQYSVLAPVYPIAIGDANARELRELAGSTGGEYFNATGGRLGGLAGIFEQIRGFQ